MGNLFHWECIRARYNRQILSVFLIILALMILSVQTERTFFPVITKRIKMLSMFQIYTQFGFLFLGYVYIRGFTMDSKNGTFPFVQQIGYSFRAIMGMKSVIYCYYDCIHGYCYCNVCDDCRYTGFRLYLVDDHSFGFRDYHVDLI